MIDDQRLGDALSRQLHESLDELGPDSALADQVIGRHHVRRRRARLAGTATGAAGLAVAGFLAFANVGSPGSSSLRQLGHSHLRLASYTFSLPSGAHSVSVSPAACAIPAAVVYTPGAGEGATTPSQPTIVQAVTDNGGCVSMLLTDPYTPGAANAPHEAFPVVDQHSVQIGSYTGTVGTAEFIGDGTVNGVTVPSGTTHQFLTLNIPAPSGQVQDLQVAVAGISEQQLVAIVTSGLTQPETGS